MLSKTHIQFNGNLKIKFFPRNFKPTKKENRPCLRDSFRIFIPKNSQCSECCQFLAHLNGLLFAEWKNHHQECRSQILQRLSYFINFQLERLWDFKFKFYWFLCTKQLSKSSRGEHPVEVFPIFTCKYVVGSIYPGTPDQTKNDKDLKFGTHTHTHTPDYIYK